MNGRGLLRISATSLAIAAMLSGVSHVLTACAPSTLLPSAVAYALLVLP